MLTHQKASRLKLWMMVVVAELSKEEKQEWGEAERDDWDAVGDPQQRKEQHAQSMQVFLIPLVKPEQD